MENTELVLEMSQITLTNITYQVNAFISKPSSSGHLLQCKIFVIFCLVLKFSSLLLLVTEKYWPQVKRLLQTSW